VRNILLKITPKEGKMEEKIKGTQEVGQTEETAYRQEQPMQGNYNGGGYPQTPPVFQSSPGVSRITKAVEMTKKLMGSWILLLLAISCTVTTVFDVVDTFMHITVFGMIIDIIKIVLAICLCVGIWQTWKAGRDKTPKLEIKGAKMVGSVVNIRMGFVMALAVLIGIVLLIIFITIKNAADKVDTAVGAGGEVATGGTVIMIVGFVIVAAVIAVISMFISSFKGVINAVTSLHDHTVPDKTKFYFCAVVIFIIGVFNLIGVIGKMALTETISSLFGSITDSLPDFISGSIGGMFTTSWTEYLTMVCETVNYLFGGIVIILYSKRLTEIFR